MVVGSSEVEGVAGGELRGGERLRWRSAFCAPVVSDRSWVAGQLRKDQGELGVYWREGECLAGFGRRAGVRDGTRRERQCGVSA